MGLPAWAIMAMTVASTAATAYGAIQQGKASAAASRTNAAIMAQNAANAERASEQRAEQGNIETANKQQASRAKMGALISNEGASGVDISSGSFQSVQQSADKIGQLEVNDVRTNASREAYGYAESSANYTTQSNALYSQAKQQEKSGYLTAATSLLGSAASLNSAWNSYISSKSLTMSDINSMSGGAFYG